MKIKTVLTFVIILFCSQLYSQEGNNLIYVDDNGFMRWTNSNEKAYFWGVNYSTPFAFSYRAIKALGYSHEKVIDHDIEQFKRLGLNAYRIHVWDREVSDKEGNLIDNEHLRLLDYLVSKLIENDIYIILTPIAWWGNGYPEPDYPTDGFSSFGSKMDLSTKPEFIEAEKKYLKQFVNHKNIYTGNAYKNEPKIIAFEIINEPSLPPNSDSVTAYINQMVDVLRNNEVTKPIFFNISQNPDKEQWIGVANSNIEGISFQWYPTGLVKGNTLEGNYLPHVSQYPLPNFSSKINNKAKMVYEFDAPDIAASTMYPMMASSFKKAGMQWTTMFSYDPTPIAAYNPEYITHYLNLAYTPSKAIGFMIAANLFMNSENSEVNANSNKNNKYSVSYKEDLSLLNSDTKFIYSNTTDIKPANVEKLENVSGVGNSYIVNYEGTGAYFLDKIENGKWKLEVFPDAVWIKDPFGNNNLSDPVARLIWQARKIKLNLPKIGNNYYIFKNNSKYEFVGRAKDYQYKISPGSYIISNSTLAESPNLKISTFNFEELKKYSEHKYNSVDLTNTSPKEIYEGDSLVISAGIYSPLNNFSVSLFARRGGWRGYRKIEMTKSGLYKYQAKVPNELLTNGIIEYFISVKSNEDIYTFPGNYSVEPNYWGFNSEKSFKIFVKPQEKSRVIFNPVENVNDIVFPNVWSSLRFRAGIEFNDSKSLAYTINLNEYKKEIEEFALQFFVGNKIESEEIEKILLDIDLISDFVDSLELRFIYSDNQGFVRKVSKNEIDQVLLIEIQKPTPIRFALIPRPYPTFLPYWYKAEINDNTSGESELEFIQIAIQMMGVELNSNINTVLKINEIRNVYKSGEIK